MIEGIFYSLAGMKRREEVDSILLELQALDYISKADKVHIKYTLEVAEQGKYPSEAYYDQFYNRGIKIKSISELKNYTLKVKDFYAREAETAKILEAINETTTLSELNDRLGSLVESSSIEDDSDEDYGRPRSYQDLGGRPDNVGFLTGIPEVDKCTNGFQPGTIAGVCAFVSEGKSTACVSMIYKWISDGKKGVLFSLEMHPELVWLQIESRFLYQEFNMDVKASDLIQRTLTEEKAKLVNSHDKEFKEKMSSLLIWDESKLSKQIMQSDRLLKRVLKKAEQILGGLDFIVFDHVNQFELMYPEMGNQCIRTIQAAVKTYVNQEGLPLFCQFAVQCNRDGNKRARKRDGRYDLAAIADLNETERSCSYVLFLFTSEDMRMSQETKITFAKNRLGELLVEPVVTTFNPSVMVVGELVNKVEYQDDFGSFDAGGFDSFDVDDF